MKASLFLTALLLGSLTQAQISTSNITYTRDAVKSTNAETERIVEVLKDAMATRPKEDINTRTAVRLKMEPAWLALEESLGYSPVQETATMTNGTNLNVEIVSRHCGRETAVDKLCDITVVNPVSGNTWRLKSHVERRMWQGPATISVINAEIVDFQGKY